MPQSQPPDDAIRLPQPARDALEHELDAEIADHLASATHDLARRGQLPDDAHQQALARFGDVKSIKRRCWWIHQGDQVMFRTASIGLMAALTIGILVIGIGGWQLQRTLGTRTQELSEQLTKLTETQQAMLAQQRAPEITGKLFLGDGSLPASKVPVKIWCFNEATTKENQRGEVVRVVETDADGRYQSGPLPMGDYCVLAPLQRSKDYKLPSPAAADAESYDLLFTELQSQPIYLVAVHRISPSGRSICWAMF